MEREYEIITSEEVWAEKKGLGIEYTLYLDKYLDVVRILLENSKIYNQIWKENERNKSELFDAYEKFPHNMDNIITIVGGRGSGKTTVMQEIRTIFLNFNDKKKEWINKIGGLDSETFERQREDEFAFSVMEVIDASVLEEKDDLLELILWHIYREVNKKVNAEGFDEKYNGKSWERQKFVEALDEVYRMHQSVKGNGADNNKGESVVTALETMPNSIRTRQAMCELLDMFFKILFPHKERNAYLVISIDDLDLNIAKGYEMLEEIRRYLLDWRIIVLLAVDYAQMEKVCEAHFNEEFNLKGFWSDENNLMNHISKLSNSYIAKVMPLPNRIYLDEESLKKAKIWEKKNNTYVASGIKKYLLFEIARKMHIYYDAYGLKTHFCEPKDIRELTAYIGFLKSLYTVDWTIPDDRNRMEYLTEQLAHYEKNYIKFNQDIADRMAFQILSPKQREIFEELRKRDLMRRSGYVLQCYENYKAQKETLKQFVEKEHFDFGEFLGCIYNWGRMDYDYKPLMHCLLASFTCEMTREYYNYRYNFVKTNEKLWEKKESARQSKERLNGYIGDNISGGWLSESMGEVFWMDQVEISSLKRSSGNEGGEEANDKKEYPVLKGKKSIAGEKAKEIQYIRFDFTVLIPRNTVRGDGRYIKIINELANAKILPILECVFMCINNYKVNKGGSACKPVITVKQEKRLKLEEKVEEQKEISMAVRIEGAKYADVDILGFMKHSVDYQEWKENISVPVYKELLNWAYNAADYKMMRQDYSREIIKAHEKLKKTSIFDEKKIEDYEMAFPLYNLDLAYNVMKRVRRKCREEFSTPVEINDVIDRILMIYHFIESELFHEEERYREFSQNTRKFVYKENFENDPYISNFRKLSNDKKAKELLLKQLKLLYVISGKLEGLIEIGKGIDLTN